MAEQNETIESLKLKLKASEEKNNNLEAKLTELNVFIQKQFIYIKKLKEELNEKELIILKQQEKSANDVDEKLHEKSPKTPLSIKIPTEGKIAYKYSKISSPDGTYTSFSSISPTHVHHMKHSSTEDNLVNKDGSQARKLSQTNYLSKESKLSASESNIRFDQKLNGELLSKPHDKLTNASDSDVGKSYSCDFEDKEIMADQITVFILKLLYSKNDKNKKDISFIISIRNADNGDELWKIEKSYTDILNLENTV